MSVQSNNFNQSKDTWYTLLESIVILRNVNLIVVSLYAFSIASFSMLPFSFPSCVGIFQRRQRILWTHECALLVSSSVLAYVQGQWKDPPPPLPDPQHFRSPTSCCQFAKSFARFLGVPLKWRHGSRPFSLGRSPILRLSCWLGRQIAFWPEKRKVWKGM